MKGKKVDWDIVKRFSDRIESEHKDVKIQKYIDNRGYHPNLSNLAIDSPRIGEYPKRYIDITGNVVTLRNIENPPRPTKSARGEIHGFSNKSRRNLLRFLQSIDWNKFPVERIYEVTLTYHSIPESGEVVKAHVHKIRKNIMDKYPGTVLIWKLEFQRRGAPHYHLIMIAPKEIELGDYQLVNDSSITYYDRNAKKHLETGVVGFRAYLQFRWNTILGEDDMHFNSGIEVEKVKNPKALPQYLAKYIAKERRAKDDQTDQHKVPEWYKSVGRFWGCYNKSLLNIRKQRKRISEKGFVCLSEYVRKQWKEQNLPDYKGHEYGLTYFARGQDEINKEIMDILIDNEGLLN